MVCSFFLVITGLIDALYGREFVENKNGSLMAMSRYQEAMEIYEKVTKMVQDELGLPPSPEMLKRFQVMGEYVSQTAEVTEDIRKRLDEKDHIEGAYYCSFPGFVDIYHVLRRMMERNGTAAYIILCTLKQVSSPEAPVCS